MTTADETRVEEAIAFLKDAVDSGEHWYVAILKTMARWDLPEEAFGGRTFRYLIGGEAFDWLLLAERLLDELGEVVAAKDRDALLFHGQPPIEIDEDEFQRLVGTPKHQAYLNFLYGIVVEEALQLAIEQEVEKEQQGHVWSAAEGPGETAFQRLYGYPQDELLKEFRDEKGLAREETVELYELREFTYWLFKFRVRRHEGARVASDTRKGLIALSKLEAASRGRLSQEPADTLA